jgi:Spy/CpxP family protein refolding chaperone
MRYRLHAAALAAIAGVALMPLAAAGQPADAADFRTPWGHPDLQGTWDYRTLTPLQRPVELGDKAFLTEPLRTGQ